MEWVNVAGSGRIRRFGWEARKGVEGRRRDRVGRESGLLQIEFVGGERWYYFEVPLGVFEGLLVSESKGKYFHAHIKGRFNDRRAEEVERLQTIG